METKQFEKAMKHTITVKPVLKTTSIKRPTLHNDYSQVHPTSNIW